MFICSFRFLIVLLLVSCGSSGEDSSAVKAAGTCVDMRVENQCVTRTVCKVMCGAAGAASGTVAGGSVGASAGVGAATAVCGNVCETLPECTPVSVCARWSHDPY